MKAAKFYGIRDVRIEDIPEPTIESGDDVIIKVKAVGICGSDISKYGKTGPHLPGEVPGHEFSGIVVEVGPNVKSVKVGDRVAVCPSLPCFQCDFCKQGIFSECESLNILGNHNHLGAFAEYTKISERNLVKIPEDIDFETAAGMEPACIAGHGLFRAKVKVEDTVAVLGVGPIGLFLIQWAKIFGASKVIAIDIFDEKLQIAKELGADFCINSKICDPVAKVKEITDSKGVDVAMESAGTSQTCAQVLLLPRKGGKVLYVGVPYSDVTFSRDSFEKIMRNELTLIGSWFSNSFPFPGREWYSALRYMREGKLKVKPLITHRIGIEDIPATLEKIYKREIFFGKIMVIPEK